MTSRFSRKSGRRATHDWDALFIEWATSGKTKAVFLAEKGLSFRTGNVQRATRAWGLRLEALSRGAIATVAEELGGRTDYVSGNAGLANGLDGIEGQGGSSRSSQEDPTSTWSQIHAWRERQAVADYTAAKMIRDQLEAIIRASQGTQVMPDGRTVMTTSLAPKEILQLTKALECTQRIQRLALGLSTQNVGVDNPAPDTHVAKASPDEAKPIPTFIVEMAGGKFLRPRPRRII